MIFNAIMHGGGSLEFETGVWTPLSAEAAPTIYFSKQHDKPPTAVWMMRLNDSGYSAGTPEGWEYLYWADITSAHIGVNSSYSFGYVNILRIHPSSSSYFLVSTSTLHQTIDETGDGTESHPRTYVSETGFCPNLQKSGSGRWPINNYKWFAIWI